MDWGSSLPAGFVSPRSHARPSKTHPSSLTSGPTEGRVHVQAQMGKMWLLHGLI
jgi:hypothetical protein